VKNQDVKNATSLAKNNQDVKSATFLAKNQDVKNATSLAKNQDVKNATSLAKNQEDAKKNNPDAAADTTIVFAKTPNAANGIYNNVTRNTTANKTVVQSHGSKPR
jgi:hypothetical protein